MTNRNYCLCAMSFAFLFVIWQSVIFAELGTPSKASSDRTLLVITPNKFQETLTNYIRHKQKQLSVQVIDLETILRKNDGFDDPERLKRYLYALWKKQKIDYVLLVGDADIFPVRYMVLDRITPNAFDYAFYPSDLYYADLARKDGSFDDWNAQRESFHAGYYGEVRGEKNKEGPINFDDIDYIPEIAVGRWPVSTMEEVKLVANKTIGYENKILAGIKPDVQRIALISVAGWVDTRNAMEKMSSGLSPEWIIEKRYFSDKKKQYKTPPPTAKEVVLLLNKGVNVICHAGHGKDLLWDRSFALKHLDQVHNADNLPIIFSAACHTARFATLPPYESYIDIHGTEHKGSDHGQVFKKPPPPLSGISSCWDR